MSKKQNEMTFKYIFTYDYNPVYVNGAHGGISPRGELVINFYLERQPLPNAISHEITQAGQIGPETEVEPSDLGRSLVRQVINGIVVNHQTARELHYWLGEKLKELDALEQARQAMAAEQAGQVTH
ncbi:hypothetical protein KOM00_09800 [Geomonas sp. Red69]|uniref:Uncharacterized protein n=1 Tax=Geomonas diazotrophica TaxID=2843197 RepID=A0ABX8JMF2_9BACT|nr:MULTISPECIES: hypothetical protein [Geomonas]MBU5637027.1 hypothetical protein [Geomonas diazotrophica]QWV98923.1 hypothetical protein KP005_06490 [Geomonas nitrogeniifigens]QXE88071.1 hypothetical protein KP003_06645 [Geomonas nitrogeniifigens]